MKQGFGKVLAVALALLVATLLLAERTMGDWRFAGYFLLAYLLLTVVQWLWKSSRRT